jgi:hypothetical protein
MHVPVLNQPSPCCHGAPRSDKQVAGSDQQEPKAVEGDAIVKRESLQRFSARIPFP